MKRSLKLTLPFLTALSVFLYTAFTPLVFAVQGSIYFSPGNGTFNPGQTVTVEVRGNVPANTSLCGGATINATYPTALLQATSASSSGGALGGNDPTINNGTVTYSRFMCPSKAVNNQKIFSITFKVLAAGTASLNFSSNTSINDGPTTRQPATLTIVNPSCPSGQVGTPPNCTTPAPAPSTPTPTGPSFDYDDPGLISDEDIAFSDDGAYIPEGGEDGAMAPSDLDYPDEIPTSDDPVISEESVSPAYDSASVTWKTSEGSVSTFRYGSSEDALSSEAEVVTTGTENSAQLAHLQLGTSYYYEIVAQNASGASSSSTGNFTTKAYPVTVRVTQGVAPLKDATISLKGRKDTYTTNKKGEVELSLMPSTYTMNIKKDTLSEQQSFDVKKIEFASGTQPDTQIVTVKLPSGSGSLSGNSNLLLLIAGIVALIAIVVASIIGFIVWRRRRASQASLGYTSIIEHDYTEYPSQITTSVDPASSLVQQTYPQAELQQEIPAAAYTPPQSQYSTPTSYAQPSLQYVDPAAIPMAQSPVSEEVTDMWSAPPTATLEPPYQVGSMSQSNDSTQQNTTTTQPVEVPVTSEPLETVQPSIGAQLQTTQNVSYPSIELPVAETLQSDANPDNGYEYNEDNSMTIHHAH